MLNLEPFDLLNKEWKTERFLTLCVDDDKFVSGAFHDVFKATPESGSQCKEKWVVKEYNVKSKNTIEDTLKLIKDQSRNPYKETSTDAHCGPARS